MSPDAASSGSVLRDFSAVVLQPPSSMKRVVGQDVGGWRIPRVAGARRAWGPKAGAEEGEWCERGGKGGDDS